MSKSKVIAIAAFGALLFTTKMPASLTLVSAQLVLVAILAIALVPVVREYLEVIVD
jgi:hypothetical protein